MEVNEPIEDYSSLDLNKVYTYWDYLNFRFKERVEIIKGKLFKMSPAPASNHQIISGNIEFSMAPYFRGKACRFFHAPFDVRLAIEGTPKDSTVVQPDLCVVCDEHKIDSRGCNGSPDLIIEILSPGNRAHDLHNKYQLYEEAKVPEYWIIDGVNKTILVYVLKENEYYGLQPFIEGMTIKGNLFPDLELKVDDVFQDLLENK